MITNFGKFCRILRINRSEVLKDMADSLNVSSAFLSSVENGKKEIPVDWYNRLISIYSLDQKEAESLKRAIESSKKVLKISLEAFSSDDRSLALSFARKLEEFDKLDSDSKDKLRTFLEEL